MFARKVFCVGTLATPIAIVVLVGSGFEILTAPVSALLAIVNLIICRKIPDDTPRCLECAYNLTGNVSGICPECGDPVTEPSQGQGPSWQRCRR